MYFSTMFFTNYDLSDCFKGIEKNMDQKKVIEKLGLKKNYINSKDMDQDEPFYHRTTLGKETLTQTPIKTINEIYLLQRISLDSKIQRFSFELLSYSKDNQKLRTQISEAIDIHVNLYQDISRFETAYEAIIPFSKTPLLEEIANIKLDLLNFNKNKYTPLKEKAKKKYCHIIPPSSIQPSISLSPASGS